MVDLPEPDLTSELDAAEEIVMGRAETVVTEWGVRWPGRRGGVHDCGDDEDTARSLAAHRQRAGIGGALVCRTGTGPWEEAPGEQRAETGDPGSAGEAQPG